MHRMRRPILLTGLFVSFASLALATPRAPADLLRPVASQSSPDISPDVNGRVVYAYNPSAQTGRFTVRNTPFTLAAGSNPDTDYADISPMANGDRHQLIQMTLDKNGQLVANPSTPNVYEMYGTVKD